MKQGWIRRGLAGWLASVILGAGLGLVVERDVRAQAKGAEAQSGGEVAQPGLKGPAPAWIAPVAVPSVDSASAEGARQGVQYLLSDVQVRVVAQQRQIFRHYAMKALNEKGVENIANLDLRFDPAYERLTLHGVTVVRAGQRRERLAGLALRVIQREKDLDYLIFDGSKSVHAFLDDVRVGDIVEYQYTVAGSNPVFGGRHFGSFDLQWGSPVTRVHARLLWPADRPLNVRRLNGAGEPEMRQVDGMEERVWRSEQLAGLQLSPDAPAWYDPYAQVQWGDFGQWADVVRWALPLYQVPDRLSAPLQAEVRRIEAMSADPKVRAAEALRLVQREVRYLGVEVGAGSHAPNAPDLVFRRRFGDCKDKTLLTMSLLKALGIEARAALVHTQQGRMLTQILPRPSVFNHVIVQARIGGQTFWLDPTRATQPGALDGVGQASFEQALVVDPASQGLTAMVVGSAMVHKRRVSMQIDATAGLTQPARMTVRTELEGTSAEQMRGTLRGESAAELQKRYLNYYARSYPGISVEREMSVEDAQPGSGQMTVVERYLIKDFFAHAEARKRLEASLEVPEVVALLEVPREAIRNAPLAVGHPQELVHDLELLLPEDWTFESETLEVDDAAFSLVRKVEGSGRRLHIEDHFRSKAGFVLPENAADHAANIDKARKAIGYVVFKADDGAAKDGAGAEGMTGQINLPLLVMGVAALGGFAFLNRRWYQWDPAPASGAPVLGDKLGGPLLLMAIGVLINGWHAFHGAWNVLSVFDQGLWNMFTVVGASRYHPAVAPLLMIEIVASAAQVTGWCLLALVFFKRRSSAARIWLIYMWSSVVFSALDHWAISMTPPLAGGVASKDVAELIRSFVVVGIWTWYLLVSTRVRSTFVCRYRDTPLVASPANPLTVPDPAAGSTEVPIEPEGEGVRAPAPPFGEDPGRGHELPKAAS